MDLLAVVLFSGLVATFGIRAWKAHGRLSARDRWALVTSFAVAITSFAVAALLINWVMVPTTIWLAAVVLLAGGSSARCCAGRGWPGSPARTRDGGRSVSAPP